MRIGAYKIIVIQKELKVTCQLSLKPFTPVFPTRKKQNNV